MPTAPSAYRVPTSRLKRSRLKVRFCTNESQKSRRELVGLLRRQGFDISEGEVTAPAPAASLILKERSLRPHLLVCDGKPAGPWARWGRRCLLSKWGLRGDVPLTWARTGEDTSPWLLPLVLMGLSVGRKPRGLPAGDQAPSIPGGVPEDP